MLVNFIEIFCRGVSRSVDFARPGKPTGNAFIEAFKKMEAFDLSP